MHLIKVLCIARSGKVFVRIRYTEDGIKRIVRRKEDLLKNGAACSLQSLTIGDSVDALWVSTGRYHPAVVIGPCKCTSLYIGNFKLNCMLIDIGL